METPGHTTRRGGARYAAFPARASLQAPVMYRRRMRSRSLPICSQLQNGTSLEPAGTDGGAGQLPHAVGAPQFRCNCRSEGSLQAFRALLLSSVYLMCVRVCVLNS